MPTKDRKKRSSKEQDNVEKVEEEKDYVNTR